jgi:hypothetical protein
MHVKPFRMHEQNESGAMYKCAPETPVERHTDELQRSCNLGHTLCIAVHIHNTMQTMAQSMEHQPLSLACTPTVQALDRPPLLRS